MFVAGVDTPARAAAVRVIAAAGDFYGVWFFCLRSRVFFFFCSRFMFPVLQFVSTAAASLMCDLFAFFKKRFTAATLFVRYPSV